MNVPGDTPFLALPYALYGSIKLYTGIESLECQELAMSCCRAFRGFSVNYHTRELCGGVDGCNCISTCWYSLARRSEFVVISSFFSIAVVHITSDLLPWAGFLFWNMFESQFSMS